jgi:hypothetical protein
MTESNLIVLSRIVLAILLMLCSAFIVAMNWGCLITNLKNKMHKIDRHHSTVSIVSLVLAVIAYIICPRPKKLWLFIVPIADIANWQIVWLPIALFLRSRSKRPKGQKPPERKIPMQ